MSEDMVKQVRITADGEIKLFDAELVNSFSKLMDITFSGSSDYRCEKLDVIAKELDADGAFIISNQNEKRVNMVISSLYAMNADIEADIKNGKITPDTFPCICGDVDVVVFKDGDLVPADKVINVFIPFIAIDKLVETIEGLFK